MRQILLFIIICFSVLVICCDDGELWIGDEYAKLKGASYVNNNTLSIRYIVKDVSEMSQHDNFYQGVIITGKGSGNTQSYKKKDRTSPVTDKNGNYVINVKVSPDFISGYEVFVNYDYVFSFKVP